jgi:hypothetical protein
MMTRIPGAVQHEVMHRRPGIVTNSEFGTVPDQHCTARKSFALHCIRDTRTNER